MKNVLSTVILLITVYTANAQQKSHPGKLAFGSVQQVALINGNDAVSVGLQSVNGITWKHWFTGLGVGLDFYRYRSVPLFIDIKRSFPLKTNALFVYVDAGYNLPWLKSTDEYNEWPWGYYKREHDFKGRLYLDGGAGLAVKMKHGQALLLSAGYSYKGFDEIITTTTKGSIGTPQETQSIEIQKNKYRFNRLLLKLGWQF